MRTLMLIVVLAALAGCRSNVMSPVAVPASAERPAPSVRGDGDWEPTGGVELKRLRVSVSGDSITWIADIKLNGWIVDQFAGGGWRVGGEYDETWSVRTEIDVDLDGYCEFETGFNAQSSEGLFVVTAKSDPRSDEAERIDLSPGVISLDERQLRFTHPLSWYGLAPGQPFNFRFNLADSYYHYVWLNGRIMHGAASLGPTVKGIATPDQPDPIPMLRRR